MCVCVFSVCVAQNFQKFEFTDFLGSLWHRVYVEVRDTDITAVGVFLNPETSHSLKNINLCDL